ncbi:MAG: hypothetical protein JWP03_3320 [Phycisphaerales bacterium]|jgi:hypothetical protein|nr:hypothetical protein [Phycisphaerales bacterium]
MAEGIVLFIGALCIAALAGVTLGVVHRKWAARPPVVIGREPRCGQCGYIVRGIATFICPECGSDLREVGIDTGHARQPAWVSTTILSILWTILLLPVAAWATGVIEDALPRWSRVTHTASLQTPTSGTYLTLLVNASTIVRIDAVPSVGFLPSDATTELVTLQGRSSLLTMNLQTGAYSYKTIQGTTVQSTGPVDTQALLVWMKAAGVDTTNPSTAMEAAELLLSLREQPRSAGGTWGESSSGNIHSHFRDGSNNWSGTRFRKPWPTGLLVFCWFALWLAGLRWIMRRIGSMR